MASTRYGSSLGSELLASRVPPNAAPSKTTAPGVVDAGLRSQQHCTFSLARVRRKHCVVPGTGWSRRFAGSFGSDKPRSLEAAWVCSGLSCLCATPPTRPWWATVPPSHVEMYPFQTSLLMPPTRHTSPSEMAIRGPGEAPPPGPMGDTIPRRPPVRDTHPFP